MSTVFASYFMGEFLLAYLGVRVQCHESWPYSAFHKEVLTSSFYI